MTLPVGHGDDALARHNHKPKDVDVVALSLKLDILAAVATDDTSEATATVLGRHDVSAPQARVIVVDSTRDARRSC